ncbi:chemotaxis protein [Xanthomonas citri pv. citri]|uniref:Chemotaxis transducer n=4 Tax=Xanthomonas citri TaxID=346 RepID=A0AAI8ETQ3_XANAC|nr:MULTISPECIES: chemotaxis transducer [Xanthomonas]AAM38115.1 chemotaxis transducer [Xanthomonas citri pv. citri str. 306]AGH78755.1 chemotaxis transducer [Xanthomonas axonopodis Xac29-1]AGI09774.1 Methyl-accepting chemotaxis protein [Xanthomonas citri subsp. citri Aw12879]AJD69867.1 hypothetical protein J151_03458 [Xanthomonas citri subsp. citri A306]AJY83379.1 Methyl-accepting chemotaxis protein [Xanthomonas citri pv. citri]
MTEAGHGAKLVEIAGRTMQELLSSVKEFSQIVGTIAAASSEQNVGIEQISQIDGATQQNATLVDTMGSSARSLENQASLLVQSVAERGRCAPAETALALACQVLFLGPAGALCTAVAGSCNAVTGPASSEVKNLVWPGQARSGAPGFRWPRL